MFKMLLCFASQAQKSMTEQSCCTRVSLQGQTKSPRSLLPFISVCFPSSKPRSPSPVNATLSGVVFLSSRLFSLNRARAPVCAPLSAPPCLFQISPASASPLPACLPFTLVCDSPSLLWHSSLSTRRACDGNLRPSRSWGEHSPAVHIQAAAFPISPRVSVFPLSTLSVCPSATVLPSPAALLLQTPLLAIPLRAFQASHKSFLPSKLVVSSGRFT